MVLKESAEDLGGKPIQTPRPTTLRLTGIVLKAFKTFVPRTYIGPIGELTCILGPNGSGKSVIGEAIAFGLGASAQMLRVKNISNLISMHAIDGSAAPSEAYVVLHFTTVALDTGSPLKEISVKRTVTRRGRTQSYFTISDAQSLGPLTASGDAAMEMEMAGVESDNDGDDDGEQEDAITWHAASAAEISKLLAENGLKDSVERLVITQHRRAVEISDPVKLARLVEDLIGTSALREDVEAMKRAKDALTAEEDELDTKLEMLTARGEELAPAVDAWKRFTELKIENLRRVADVAADKARLAAAEAQEAADGLLDAEKKITAARVLQEDIKNEANALLEVKEAADSTLEETLREVKSAENEGRQCDIKLQRAKIHLKEAEKAAKAISETFNASDLEEAEKMASRDLHKAEQVCGRLCGLLKGIENKQTDLAAALKHVEEEQYSELHSKGNDASVTEAFHATRQQLELARAKTEAADAEVALVGADLKEVTLRAAGLKATVAVEHNKVATYEGALEDVQGQLRANRADEVKMAAAHECVTEEMDEVEASLKDLEENLVQAQTNSDTLGRRLDELQVECAQVDGSGGRQTVDQAVAALTQRAQHGDLPGRFYGRLHSLIRVADPSVVGAVNAYLQEFYNMASASLLNTRTALYPATTLVVSNRATAQALVQHFKQHRVGIVCCLVIEDFSKAVGGKKGGQGPLQQHHPSASPGGLMPLISLVHTRDASEVPGIESLAAEIFQGWYLCDTSEEALAVVKERIKRNNSGSKGPDFEQRRSVVTRDGCLFKADGEIVGRRSPEAISSFYARYALTESFYDASCGSFSRAAAQGGEAARKALEKMQAEHAAAAEAVRELEQLQDDCNSELQSLGKEFAVIKAKQRKLGGQRRDLEKGRSKTEQLLSAAIQAHDAASADLSTAEAERAGVANRLVAAAAMAATRRKELENAKQALRDVSESTSAGRKAFRAVCKEAELHAQQQALLDDMQKYKIELKSGEQEIVKLKAMQQTIHEVSEKLLLGNAAVHEADAEVKAARNMQREAHRRLKEVKSTADKATAAWREAIERHQDAAKVYNKALGVKRTLREKEKAAKERSTKLWKDSIASKESSEKLAADTRTILGTIALQAAQQPVPPAPSDSESSSDSDFEPRVTKSRRGGRTGGSSAMRTCAPRNTKTPREISTTVCSAERLAAADAELAKQTRELQRFESHINMDAAMEGIEIMSQVAQTQEQLHAKEAESQQLAVECSMLEIERYSRFVAAMNLADSKLSSIYQQLTGGVGDAHCSFPPDTHAAFTQGVCFKVRPDASSWRPFSALSGGQQALAALSLCLALQAAAPAPFFFFDEIDAALDYLNAGRLAKFLKGTVSGAGCEDEDDASRTGFLKTLNCPQIIAVSHKPDMAENADTWIGVTCAPNGKGSQIVTQSLVVDMDGNDLLVVFEGQYV